MFVYLLDVAPPSQTFLLVAILGVCDIEFITSRGRLLWVGGVSVPASFIDITSVATALMLDVRLSLCALIDTLIATVS